MEAKAVARYIRISPRKVQRVVDMVKGRNVEEALGLLKFTPNTAATLLEKTIQSAVANAINIEGSSNIDVEDLHIKSIDVGQGPTMRRFRPRSMGRASRIRKRTSHLTVVVGDEE